MSEHQFQRETLFQRKTFHSTYGLHMYIHVCVHAYLYAYTHTHTQTLQEKSHTLLFKNYRKFGLKGSHSILSPVSGHPGMKSG